MIGPLDHRTIGPLILQKNRLKEYLKYFDWTKNFDLYRMSHWCQLCRKLNDIHEPKKTYSNITDWWIHDSEKSNACEV